MGFGDEGFGEGIFGAVDWGLRATWEKVPAGHRDLDAQNGDALYKMLRGMADELEVLRERIGTLPMQRDPYLARSRDDENEAFRFSLTGFLQTTQVGYDTTVQGDGLTATYDSTMGDVPASGPIPSDTLPLVVDHADFRMVAGAVTFRDNGDGTLTGTSVGGGGSGFINYETGDWEITLVDPTEFNVVNVIVDYVYYDSTTYSFEETADWGMVLKLLGVSGDVLEGIGPAWTMFIEERTYMVQNVRSRLDEPELWVSGPAVLVVPVVWTVTREDTNEEGDGQSLSYSFTLGNFPVLAGHSGLPTPSVLSIVAGIVTFTDDGDGTLAATGGSGGSGIINYLTGEVTLTLNDPTDFYNVTVKATYETVDEFQVAVQPTSLLDWLAQDYGFENDQFDPSFVRRSVIANLVKYFGIKATSASYSVRGEASGFDVIARGLYRISDPGIIARLPSSRVYQAGTGEYYTDINPRQILYDDIAADLVYFYIAEETGVVGDGILTNYQIFLENFPIVDGYSGFEITCGTETFSDNGDGTLTGSLGGSGTVDYQTGEVNVALFNPAGFTASDEALVDYAVPILDNELMIEDISADGMSTGLAFSINVVSSQDGDTPLTIDSAVALTDADLRALGLTAGYRVVVTMTGDQYSRFNFRGGGVFGLTEGYPPLLSDQVFWIDYHEDWLPGANPSLPGTWTVIVGGETAPATGNGALRYRPAITTTCSYCRSNKIRLEIEASPEAFDYYGDVAGVEDARDRLVEKITDLLVPIHAEILEPVGFSMPVSFGGSSFHFTFTVL